MGKAIGIDFGTTTSVAAIVDGPQVRVLCNQESKSSTPSAVSLRRRKGREEEVLVGDVALANWPMAPKDTIVSIKRLIGRGVADPEVQKVRANYLYDVVEPADGTRDSVRVVMGDKQYSPVQIAALILKKIKEDAEFRLNDEVTDAVITVPAYFSQAQRAATRLAGQQAGMRVIKILDESTAAAIGYGVDSTESTEPKYILIYDLGGGTFDISVLLWGENVFVPLSLEGDMWLGGDNFDQVIVDRAVAYIKKEYGVDPTKNLRCMALLKKAAQDAKERLTSARTAEIIITGALQDNSGNLIDVEMEITREQFEDWIRPLLDKTITLAEKALTCAGLSVEEIAHVIMAGNSTCIPLVQQEVEKKFGAERLQQKMHPKLSVAQGAAKVAAVLCGKIVCQALNPSLGLVSRECGHVNRQDATKCEKCGTPIGEPADEAAETYELIHTAGIVPISYGIQTADDRYIIVVRKNDPFPTSEESRIPVLLRTALPNQRIIRIPVYGGDNLAAASLNEKQGEAIAVLPPRLPEGTTVRVRLWLDSDGVFELSAHLEDETDLRPWVMKGEADQKVIEMLQRVDQNFKEVENDLEPHEREVLEQVRNDAFEAMRRHQFEMAMQRAQEFWQKLSQREKSDPPRQKAENLIGFAQFVLHRNGWAFDGAKQFQLRLLIEQAREAMESGDRMALEKKVAELEKATGHLPRAAQLLVNMFMAIQSRVRPSDPVYAANLMDELEEMEWAIKAGTPEVQEKLDCFVARLAAAIDHVGGTGSGRANRSQRCIRPGCNANIPAGAHRCPRCGLPAVLLDSTEAETRPVATDRLQTQPGSPFVPGGQVDGVHFSVTSPDMAPGASYVVGVWAHLASQRNAVLRMAKDETGKAEIRITSEGPFEVAKGTVLNVRMCIQGFLVEPLEKTILWRGEVGSAGFAVTVPSDTAIGSHVGTAVFLVGGIPLAKLFFVVTVAPSAGASQPLAVEERRYRTAFASYASEDRDAVLARIHGMLKAVPRMDVFLDVASLRSGEKWQERLRHEIIARDVLYLFWSTAASRSKWVDWEWRCGLRERGLQFIDPCPLVPPDVAPPPPELAAALHFNDWVLAYMSARNAL